MSCTTIPTKILTIHTQGKSGEKHTILGYRFKTGLVLIAGEKYDIFFASVAILKAFSVEGVRVLSVEEGREEVFTERDLLDSVTKTMKYRGGKNVPMEQILFLLQDIHSSD